MERAVIAVELTFVPDIFQRDGEDAIGAEVPRELIILAAGDEQNCGLDSGSFKRRKSSLESIIQVLVRLVHFRGDCPGHGARLLLRGSQTEWLEPGDCAAVATVGED